MKITVDVDCTPAEAREFLGLPDVKSLQAGLIEEIEKRLRDNLDQVSPQSILQTWLALSPAGMQDAFKRIFDVASAGKPGAK